MQHSPAPVPIEALLAHSEWARALARRLVGEADADEVVQETWLAALRRPPSGERPLRPWIGRVLGNVVRQRARGAGRRSEREREAAREEALPSAAELSARAESQGLLIEALLELDEPVRELVLLRYFEGLSAAEIARRSGTPAGTVRWRLHEAIDALRTRLDERSDGGREGWCAALAPLLVKRSEVLATGLSTTILGGLSMKFLLSLAALAGVLALAFVGLQLATASLGGRGKDLPRQEVAFRPIQTTEAAPTESTREVAPTERAPAGGSAQEVSAPNAAARAIVRMRFVDEAGQAVGGVVVVPSPRMERERGESDRDGRLELTLAPVRGADWRSLKYARQGFANDERSARARDGERVDLGEIVLRGGGAVRGRVIDDTGRPRAGIAVKAEGAERQEAVGGSILVEHTALGAAETVTDSDGRFVLSGLLAGDVQLLAESEDELWTGASGPVEVRAGQESSGVEIVLEELARERRIEGIVLDPEGTPMPHATIVVRTKSWLRSGSSTAQSDADGRFRALLQWSGEWDISASDPKQRFSEVTITDVEGGTFDLELRFEPARHVTLDVRAESGVPIDDWQAVLRDSEGDQSSRVSAPDAVRLPNGDFTLLVSAPGFDEVELGPFEQDEFEDGARIACELGPLPGVTGRVTIDGAAGVGVKVGLFPLTRGRMNCDGFPAIIEPSPRARATTDELGRFELTVREPGDYIVRAETPERALAELGPYEVEPAVGLAGLELALPIGATVEGRVLLDDGRPGVGAFVAASRGDGLARCVRTDSEGRYRIERLAPGRWFVTRVDRRILGGMPTTTVDGTRAAHREVPWNCELREGETTRFDLAPEELRSNLIGALSVVGVDPEGWKVELVPLDVSVPSKLSEARLDTHGAFALEIPGPGTYFLSIDTPEGVRCFEELDLDGGAFDWRRTLALGRVELSNVPDASDPTPRALVWEGPDGLFAFAQLLGDGQGQARFEHFPAGDARVAALQDPSLGEDPREWPELIGLTVPAGETARAALP